METDKTVLRQLFPYVVQVKEVSFVPNVSSEQKGSTQRTGTRSKKVTWQLKNKASSTLVFHGSVLGIPNRQIVSMKITPSTSIEGRSFYARLDQQKCQTQALVMAGNCMK